VCIDVAHGGEGGLDFGEGFDAVFGDLLPGGALAFARELVDVADTEEGRLARECVQLGGDEPTGRSRPRAPRCCTR
jgi:hypothetical protein